MIIQKRIKAVIYARVSSKEQEREGYSIDAQLKLLREYAKKKNFQIVEEFVDVESAKRKGRVQFSSMFNLLEKEKKKKAEGRCRIVLVEKTDRLYRNFYDWVKLDPEEMDIELHFVKEGTVFSKDSKSGDKLFHGFRVLLAKNMIDNLSEETKKGMHEKAAQGMWPSNAPLGYKNVDDENGRKIIVPDEERASHVIRLFENYASGKFSVLELTQKAYDDGFRTRKNRKVVQSVIHKTLRKRVYSGEFEFDGAVYKGKYEPLISIDLWEKVQDILDGKRKSKLRKGVKDWAFGRMIKCGHCGCSIIAEMQKKKYVYYHCTGSKKSHKVEYVREEVLEAQFAEMLKDIQVSKPISDWIAEALRASHKDEQKYHKDVIKDLQSKLDHLQTTLHVLYDDKINGIITPEFFMEKSEMIRVEKARLRRSIERHENADEEYIDLGVKIFELTNRAYDLFIEQSAKEKRRLLDFLFSNCVFKDGKLTAEFKQPFDIIAKSVREQRSKKAVGECSNDLSDIWLPRTDSNCRQGG